MICPKCNTVNDDDEKFCKNCGLQLNSNRVCPNCDTVNKPNSKFCHKCGTTLSPVDTFKKDVIEENAKGSFFSLYKVPIICALVIVLAIGAVAGVTMFSSGDNGGGINSIIPLSNDTFDDSNLNDYEVNHDANQTDNKTLNDTKKATMNKTEDKNAVNSTNKNKTKTYTEKTNSSNVVKKNTTKDNSKKYSEKTDDNKNKINNNTKPSDKDKSNKAKEKNKSSDSSKSEDNIIPIIDDVNDTDVDENNQTDDLDNINDTDEEIANDTEVDDNNQTDLGDDDINSGSIEMTDVPNLAQEVASRNYRFSTISYKGQEFTQAQCIDIFSEYILNVNNGRSSSIEINSVRSASNPTGEDSSQSVDKSDYLSIASRVHSWINGNSQVPNYVGVSSVGPKDLSPEKMLELFSKVILSYAVSEELPQSVDI